MTDPPLLIYQQTRDHLLLDPRPGPRHALRVDLYPRRPSDLMTAPAPRTFTTDDGDKYAFVDPAAFPDFDDADSTLIADAGAPLDDEVPAGGEH